MRFKYRVAALAALFALPLSLAMLERANGIDRAQRDVRVEMAGVECLTRGDALVRHLQIGTTATGAAESIGREADAFDALRCAPNSRPWAAIRAKLRSDPDEARRRVLARDMTVVLASIGDSSRLAYESDPLVHQLVRALAYALPKLQSRLWDAAVPQPRIATAKFHAMGMAQLAIVDGELTAAIASVAPAVQSTLNEPRLRLLASANAYSDALDAYENGPTDLRSRDAKTLFARQRAVADADAVFAIARTTLQRSLEETIASSRERLRLSWVLFAGSLAAALGLAWLIVGIDVRRARRARIELEQETWRLQAEIAREVAELEAQATEARFQAIFAGSPLAIAIVESDGAIVECNEAYLQLVGSAPAERRRRMLLDTVRVEPPEALSRMLAHLQGATMQTHQVDVSIAGRADKRLWFHALVSGVRNAGEAPVHFIVMLADITDRKDREHLYLHEATHDFLTGLPNRSFVVAALEERLRCEDAEQRFAVLFLDVNDFKSINDTLGHRAGDACLQGVAARLVSLVREHDVVARFGGDEFVIVLTDARSIAHAREIAARITSAFRAPLVIDDVAVTISLSAGLLVDRREFESADRVLREADSAMYDEKFGSPKRLATIHELKQAVPGRS